MQTTNDRIRCEECDDTVGNSKWAKIKAAQCRWLFLVNGEAYCPEHEPPWEAKWRKRSGRKARTVAQLSTMD